MDKELDSDYRILHKFLNYHDAIPRIHEALERLLARAGGPLNTPEPSIRIPDLPPKQKQPLFASVVERLAKTMTDKQIADVHGIDDVRIVTRFLTRNRIRRRKLEATKRVKIEIIETRMDKHFRMPVHIITPAFAEATSAHR